MSSYQFNEGQGSLFLNQNKNFQDPSDRKPAYTGRIMVGGRIVNISAWVKTTQDGQNFFSLQLSEPQSVQAAPPQGQPMIPPQTHQHQQSAFAQPYQPQAPVYKAPTQQYVPQAQYPPQQPYPQQPLVATPAGDDLPE